MDDRNPKPTNASDKLRKLKEYLLSLEKNNFTGYIRVTYAEGKVGRIEQFEEVLKK